MTKAKNTRKFAVAKKMISPKDTRVTANLEKAKKKQEEIEKKEAPRQIEQAVSSLFFQYNTQLGPPYHVLVDTNFINFSIRYVATGVESRFAATVTLRLGNATRSLTLFFFILSNMQQKAGYDSIDDGLFIGKMHPLHHGLCHGRIRKVGRQVQNCVEAGQGSSV
jgi:hypothetical protein